MSEPLAPEAPSSAPEPGHGPAAGLLSEGARQRLTRVLAVLAVVAAGLLVAPPLFDALRPHLYTGTVFQGSTDAPPLDGLQYLNGEPADLAAFDGKLVVLFFGFTNCTDVCPGTLSRATLAIDQLGPDGDEVELLLVGVDPMRDTPQLLEEYVDRFNPRFHSLWGANDDMLRVATLYGVHVQPNDDVEVGSAGSQELVDHTATLIGIDHEGALRIVWAPDVEIGALSADLRALLDER